MNARQQSDLNMYIAVRGLVQANTPIWTANAQFTAAFNVFIAYIPL